MKNPARFHVNRPSHLTTESATGAGSTSAAAGDAVEPVTHKTPDPVGLEDRSDQPNEEANKHANDTDSTHQVAHDETDLLSLEFAASVGCRPE